MSDSILTRQADNLFEIILNRHEHRNAIDWEMLRAFGEAVEQAERASGVRAVLVHGGERGFSSGIDLSSFASVGEQFGNNWATRIPNIIGSVQAVLTRLERCSLPTIALIRGYALGLGLELAMACDFRFAARNARLSLLESRLGLIPDVGGTTRMTRLVGPARAKEWIMTGRIIDLGQAEQFGLLNGVVPAEELYARGKSLADEISLAGPLAVSYAKRVIDGLSDIDRGLQLEAWAQNHLLRTDDFITGLQAVMSKTDPDWKGS